MAEISLGEFADKLNEIMPVIMRELFKKQSNELYKGKITLPQFFILESLHRNGESKMTDLAHFMNVTTAAMTGIVERLVKSGYCARAYEPQDRRIIKVKLTNSGNDLVRKLNRDKRQMLINIFGRVSKIDRQHYLRVLIRIRDILIKEKEGR